MGIIIRSATGDEGQVELVGVRAVVGIFLRWSLERRGENPSDARWTLRAVFSYQKDSILGNPGMKKRIKIRFPKGSWYEVVPEPGVSPRIEQERYVIEGATLCQIEEPSKSPLKSPATSSH